MIDNITTQDKLACIERELRMRERVYPKLVDQGKMSAGKAAIETKIMEAIRFDYLAQVEKERLL